MKQKLIKISDSHYIIVDDSEKGKEGYNYNFALSKIEKLSRNYKAHSSEWNYCRKITHSTKPIENTINDIYSSVYFRFNKIKHISLTEVEEAINGYSVEKMAKEIDKSRCRNFKREHTLKETYDGVEDGFVMGFKKAIELSKDKLFTVEDMMQFTIDCFNDNYGTDMSFDERVKINIESLLPKTEWDIKFNKEGKLELI